MSDLLITLLLFLAPLSFVATSLASWFQPGSKPTLIKYLGISSSILGIVISIFSFVIVDINEIWESNFIGIKGLGIRLRLDALSALMFSMIAILALIILKFSWNYLDGDQRKGTFLGRMSACIASVQFLVLSGNLGILFISWILTSISLHRLLVFYNERAGARVAARKKFVIARICDLCLLIAFGLVYIQQGSGNLEVIFAGIKNTSSSASFFQSVEAPALFLVLAAVLKSAQFPTHGWLIEMMETPTPVSSLLHAGLLNAGPFLLIRMSNVLEASSVSPLLLMIIGGITALFGSIVFLTQTSIKTALSFSSVAHMGFSLLACGMGVYAAAMLHLVAHSFYKAHAFLSSGSVIDSIRASKGKKIHNSAKSIHIVLGFLSALILYSGVAFLLNETLSYQLPLLLIGAVIVMGLSRIFISAFENRNTSSLLFQAFIIGVMVTLSFFILETLMHAFLSDQLPHYTKFGTPKMVVAFILITVYAVAVLFQIVYSRISKNHSVIKLSIHLRNGLYVNALLDRMIGSLYVHSYEQKRGDEIEQTSKILKEIPKTLKESEYLIHG